MSLFSVRNLSAGYNGLQIIREVSFDAQQGRLLGVLGANGSGKTTLLKAICGIIPHSGSCTLSGSAIDLLSARPLSRLVSYIPQRSGISIDISALDVVLMGFNPCLGLLEHPDASMRIRAIKALEQVGLADRVQDNYQQLSEGQKQLCILARTLVSESKLLLLDEPESALDFRHRYKMLQLLKSWIHEQERCAIVALHDPMLALNFCDDLLILCDGVSLGTLHPSTDSCEDMARMLERIYGPITLKICLDNTGKTHIVMLKEQEVIP